MQSSLLPVCWLVVGMSGRAFHLRRREVEVLHAVATPPCQLRLWRPCAFLLTLACTFYNGLPFQLGGAERYFPRAVAVARCFAQGAQAQPPAIDYAVHVCFVFGALRIWPLFSVFFAS